MSLSLIYLIPRLRLIALYLQVPLQNKSITLIFLVLLLAISAVLVIIIVIAVDAVSIVTLSSYTNVCLYPLVLNATVRGLLGRGL